MYTELNKITSPPRSIKDVCTGYKAKDCKVIYKASV